MYVNMYVYIQLLYYYFFSITFIIILLMALLLVLLLFCFFHHINVSCTVLHILYCDNEVKERQILEQQA